MEDEVIKEYYLKNIKPLFREQLSFENRYDIYIFEKIYLQCRNDEGEEVEIYDGDKLASGQIKYFDGSELPDWFKELGKHFNQKVKIFNEVVTLIGASYTFMDLYYIIKDSKGNKRFSSCVGKIEYLE